MLLQVYINVIEERLPPSFSYKLVPSVAQSLGHVIIPGVLGHVVRAKTLTKKAWENAVQELGNTKCTNEVDGKILVSYYGYL